MRYLYYLSHFRPDIKINIFIRIIIGPIRFVTNLRGLFSISYNALSVTAVLWLPSSWLRLSCLERRLRASAVRKVTLVFELRYQAGYSKYSTNYLLFELALLFRLLVLHNGEL